MSVTHPNEFVICCSNCFVAVLGFKIRVILSAYINKLHLLIKNKSLT